MTKFASTEVRIPLYDRSWDSLEDVVRTLEHIIQELRLEREKADLILIEIEWGKDAREDVDFMEALKHYCPAQFWLRFERK